MKFNHLISYIPTGRVDLVWKELHNEFDRNDASTIRALKFEFERLEMNSNESVSEFITKIKSSAKKLIDCKVLVSQEDMLNVLLHGVISDFNPVVEALELKSKLTFQFSCNALRNSESKRRAFQSSRQEFVTVTSRN